jgi:16S rRNA processing protein RimM
VGTDSDRVVELGKVTGVHGVRGWIRVSSFTEPGSNLFMYPDWMLSSGEGWRPVQLEDSGQSGRHLIAKLAGIDDRDAAAGLAGSLIGVRRSGLAPLAPGEYYWTDLEGLAVVSASGHRFGQVKRLIATGANDVLVLDGERMIPFVAGQIIVSVDLEAGEIVVDWDPDYWD